MKYSVIEGNLAQVKTPCLLTSLKAARAIAREPGKTAVLNRSITDFKNKLEQSITIQLDGNIGRLVIVGGTDQSLTEDQFRRLCTSAAAVLARQPVKQAVVALDSVRVSGKRSPFKQLAIMRAITSALYHYANHKSAAAPPPPLASVRLAVLERKATGNVARLGNALDAGMKFARDLGNEPPNVCNPNYLLKESRKLGRTPNVTVTNLTEKRMGELGMGAFLAVSLGSVTPGQMIIIRYNGGSKKDAPISLVGKGITFDTGGISLKPPGAMDEMKFDMCGAAAVLGATRAVIDAKLPINLVTIVAAAENMPSGIATRPGDIVRSASGKTVEILNTDAEGRLVLCDALTHAQTFKPKTIIDVATLTGACIVALGSHASAVYSNDDKLANELLNAGQTSGDKAWQMPLWDEYQSALKSNFADMANVGGREAGSVTAACFLSRFVKDVNWAHMDVAGSAFLGGARKGSTGRPVPLLFQYLCDQAGL
ncbi:MAG: leucyl aminopeptidase [Pseudomonadales bacterium]|nr:leucyl aminopeptidase [Pseudomonadales bacterium]